MLHIILTILKIIGILLLVVLGILLTAIFLILFAPFRYAIDGKKEEEICFHARVTWVLFFLRVRCSYEKKKLSYYVKVFGYSLISNEEKKKKEKKKQEKSLTKEEQLLLSEIEEESRLQAVELEQKKAQEKIRKEAVKDKKIKKEEPKKEKKVKEEAVLPKKSVAEPKKEKIQIEEKNFDSGQEKQVKKKISKNPIQIFRDTLYKILEKIRQFFSKLDEVGEKINKLLEKLGEWKDFIDDERTRKALSKLLKKVKKLLKHILPRKIKGNLTFGVEDPAMMGWILAILGMAMPIYKDNLKIEPCFGINKIQGDIEVKGKLRLGYILYLAILVLIDKEIMGTIKKARAMAKGEKESEGGMLSN